MFPNRNRPTSVGALIIASDPLGGALVGAAVELAGYSIVFPPEDQAPGEVLRALRPTHLLIDCDAPEARDETLLGNALMLGARLWLFGSTDALEPFADVATRHRMGMLMLPRDVARLAALLATGATGSTRRPPRPTAR